MHNKPTYNEMIECDMTSTVLRHTDVNVNKVKNIFASFNRRQPDQSNKLEYNPHTGLCCQMNH